MHVENLFNSDYFKKNYNESIFHKRGDRPVLYKSWIKYLLKYNQKGSLLEVGCGEGFFLKRAQEHFITFGTDISDDGIQTAKNNANKTSFSISDAGALPYNSDYFNIVIAFDVIEHLRSPIDFFNEAYRVLKNDGLLIIKTPNPHSFGARLKKDGWFGNKDETHISINSMETWENIISTSGFTVVEKGTDTLWDSPYFLLIPDIIQKAFFISIHKIMTFHKVFYKWKSGENFICIAKKSD